ncbi:MAG: hypothetical protein WAZ98_10965 [Cyclobacteriaceae bacterium]
MKAAATFYKGIEFVSVRTLPADQQLLLQHAHDPERIKILKDGKILNDCILYTNYCTWYSTVFESSTVPLPVIESNRFEIKIALSNA